VIIVLSALAGGALFLGLALIFGHAATVPLGAVCLALILIGVWSDVRRIGRDRRIARRRLRAMHENDALNRTLGEHRRG
jgi:hypothetical protein